MYEGNMYCSENKLFWFWNQEDSEIPKINRIKDRWIKCEGMKHRQIYMDMNGMKKILIYYNMDMNGMKYRWIGRIHIYIIYIYIHRYE